MENVHKNNDRYDWWKDKSAKKYKKYLKKRKKAMVDATWKRLNKKNKTTPIKYKTRKNNE